MEQEEEWNENAGEAWVGEPPADYASHTKGQFLDDLERRFKLFMVRSVKVCRSLPKDLDAQHFGHQPQRRTANSFVLIGGSQFPGCQTKSKW